MKDLSLSLLSRGCGRFVSSNGNTGGHDGRLDVCFTPEDYYIWKSQDFLLRLSNSGHLLAEAESTLPKTYSTRRGPLLLYSQDLATMETSCHSETKDRKQRVVRQYTQQVEQQLSTLKELTAAILSYSNNQFTSSRLGPPLVPSLHLPLAPDLHCPSPLPIRTTQEQPRPEFLVQLNPQWLPTERTTEQLDYQAEDKEEEQGSRKKVRLDLFLQIPSSSRTPTPQMEPQPWVHYVAMTPEEPEEPQTYLAMSLQHTESSQCTEKKHHSLGGDLHCPNLNCISDTSHDQGCSNEDSGTTGDKGSYERSTSGKRHGRKGLLPPLTESVSHKHCWEKKHRLRWEASVSDEHNEQRLPPIAESNTAAPRRSDPEVGLLHQQALFLPLLFPGKEEQTSEKQRRGDEKAERHNLKKETVGQGGGEGGGRLPSEKGILLQPREEPPAPVGVMGCVAGRKGPGKQSSLAFLQNPCESSDANRGVVRGVLPLELTDLQNGKSVGSLILGPDGEIIQVSLYDNSQYPSQGDGDTQQALQVLSAEGEKLPWVIVLQPEHTHTELEGRCGKGMELNTDAPVGDILHAPVSDILHAPVGDILHHQSTHKLLDLNRSIAGNACSPSSHTDAVAVTKKKTRSAEVAAETWKAPKTDAKNNVRMPPLRERVGKEEPRGGNTEAEEEDEEEELGSIGQTNHLSGSNQPGQQNVNPNEATAEDNRKRITKRKDAEEAATTTRKKDMKTGKSAESDGQKTLRTRKEGRWQRQKTGGDAQSIRSQQEERTNREAAKTQDHSALPSMKKKMTVREGERGEVKMNEESEERGEVARQKEESAGRKRRGRLKHKELIVENHDNPLEKEKVEINQEMGEESHQKSTKKPSATQRHNYKTKTNSEEDIDTDRSTNADKHSSSRSVSSHRSTAAASQLSQRSSRNSAFSSIEEALPVSAMGLASSHGRLSSCSTVRVTEEQLMLNSVKPESSRPRKSQEKEAAALHLAQRAERRRQEVERKRKEREEEERKQQEKQQTEERMKSELEEERRKRAEELRSFTLT
ncbi:uncharacterized protein KIAA2012 homolog [Micropterus dolomieu]|uniref:uncharacterized protein KIAA2012 homolog n=1 Tax=Micropterus dolomieu TaxID=147949 RepID=UPI001E8D1282|nr:uncharacterized protein KIAA2012 homolog [Micropterus dolomieu]